MPAAVPSFPAPLRRGAVAVLWLGTLAYGVVNALGDAADDVRSWLSAALYLAVAALIAARAVTVRADRTAWALLAAGVGLYAAGSIAYAAAGRPASTSVPVAAHAGWLAFYAFAYAAMIVLLRARMRALAATLGLDGLLGGLTLTAVASAFALPVIEGIDGIGQGDALAGLAYAAADILLLAMVLWAAWLAGRSGARMWLTLAGGVLLILLGDVVVDVQTVLGGFEEASVVRALYPAGMLVLALAAWSPVAAARRPRIDSLAVVAVPSLCVSVALALQVAHQWLDLSETTNLLTVIVLGLAFVRAVLTYRQLRVLKEGRRVLRGFEDVDTGMTISTPDGRWLRVNEAFAALLGYTPQELVGATVLDHVHPDERETAHRLRATAVQDGRPPRFERRMLRKDGSVVEVLCSTVHVDEDGDQPYLFTQIQDVTEGNRASRHSRALAGLGRMAIELSDDAVLAERARAVVAEALPDGPADATDERFLQAVDDVLTGARDRAAAEEETRRRALHDPLTGLANRTFLTAHLEQQLAAAERSGDAVSLLLLDVDRFKMVNDTVGHTAGDDLLVEVAHRLRSVTRRADVVARLGGDEFVVVCGPAESGDEPIALAERIVAAFEEAFVVGGRELVLGASVGVAAATARDCSADALLRNADVAMYRAKDEGGGRFVRFDEALRSGVLKRLALEVALRRAIERDELHVHYQPIVRLRDGSVNALEALLRWEHPEHGSVPPADFIPIAEDTGMIREIGAFVLEEVCRQIAVWTADRPGMPPRVGVNLSAVQLTPTIVDEVRAAIARHGIPAASLVLEITESLLVDGDSATELLAGLRAAGVVVVLDDFGTGYSSLGYISEYALDGIKLDRALIARIATSERARGLVRGIVEMASALGFFVLAEGVETEEQALAARELGCVFAQGWLYAKAMPPDEAGFWVGAGAPVTAG